MEPGFWVLGAGLELGYLLALATNARFQRLVDAVPLVEATADWNKRIQALARPPRCRAIARVYDALVAALPLDHRPAAARRERATVPGGLEAQADSLGRLSWMFLRLLVARRTIEQVIGEAGRRRRPAHSACATLERQQATNPLTDELRRSLDGPGRHPRAARRSSAARPSGSWPSSTPSSTRIEEQVELIREQAVLSTDPEHLSQRIDEISATLGTHRRSGSAISRRCYGAMDDLHRRAAAARRRRRAPAS